MAHSYEDVMKALRAADAAGNVEDAKKLAQIASTMKQSMVDAPEMQQQSQGVMPFVNKGIADTLGIPGDYAKDKLGLPVPFAGSEQLAKGMQTLGIPVAQGQPQSVGEHVGHGIGEVSTFMIPAGAGTRLISGGAGLAGKIGTEVMKSMVRHPWVSMASEVTAGAGVGLGRATAEEHFSGDPSARAIAELTGGIAGSLSPLALQHTPAQWAGRQGFRLLKKISMPFSEKGGKYRAGEFTKKLVADPAETSARVGAGTMSDMPPAVASGEKRLMGLYRDILDKDPISDAESIERIAKSIYKLETEMRGLGWGSPEILQEITGKRIASIQLKMDNRVAGAMNKAERKLNAVPYANRKAEEANIVYDELRSVMLQERANLRTLWREVPMSVEVMPEGSRGKYAEILGGLAKAQRDDIPVALKKSKIIRGKELEPTNVKEMQGLRSKLLEEARQARSAGQWNKARIADDVADAILDDLGNSAGVSPQLESALAATRHFKSRFEQGMPGKILGYHRSGAPAINPDLTLEISVGRQGIRGAVDMDKVLVTPEARQAAERYIGRSFADYALDKRTGQLSPAKAETWIKNNEGVLDQFPGLRDQITDARKAQEFATRTAATMEARRKAIENPKISAAARFLKSDPGTEVKNILTSDDPTATTAQLVRQARKDPSGQSLEGLRAAFVDHMLDTSRHAGRYNQAGEKVISGKVLKSFLRNNDKMVKEVFTSDQLKRANRVADELVLLERFETESVKIPDFQVEDIVSNALQLFSRVGGAQLGRVLARWLGGGTVQTPGILSERLKNFANHISNDRAMQILHEAIISPDSRLLQTLLMPMDKPIPAQQAQTLRLFNSRMNAWLMGPGRRIMEDIENEMAEDAGFNQSAQELRQRAGQPSQGQQFQKEPEFEAEHEGMKMQWFPRKQG